MATRRMQAKRRGTPKGSGGSSGFGNPRNDGRITEQQHDEAMRVLRAEYYQGVRGIAEDIIERVKSGELASRDNFERAVDESVDGSYWVIYTHANFQTIFVSDNHDAYMEDFGQAPVEGDNINWAALAYAAMRRDVQERIDAEGDLEFKDEMEERRRPHRPVPHARRRR